MLNEPDCKLGGSATSLTEKWPSADEVILFRVTGTGGPVDTTIQIGVDAPLAAPGRYRLCADAAGRHSHGGPTRGGQYVTATVATPP